MLDAISLGVAVIGINNTVNGWKMLERLRQEEITAEATFQRRRKEKKSIRA